jgi:hypothetical protein
VIGTDGRRVADFNDSPAAAIRYALVQLAESDGGDAVDFAYEIDLALAEMCVITPS